MKIELHEIPVRDVVNGYVDSAENGVVGYGGRLNIRPAFQREFIYKDKNPDLQVGHNRVGSGVFTDIYNDYCPIKAMLL